jgi:hypothetical protein
MICEVVGKRLAKRTSTDRLQSVAGIPTIGLFGVAWMGAIDRLAQRSRRHLSMDRTVGEGPRCNRGELIVEQRVLAESDHVTARTAVFFNATATRYVNGGCPSSIQRRNAVA